jgi:excisionase family DNA binding protein
MSDRLTAALEELAEAIREEVRAEAEAATGTPDRLYSVTEAAELLRVGRSTVYQEVAAGRLRSLKVGRRRLVPSSALADRLGTNGAAEAAGSTAPQQERSRHAYPPRG